MKQIAAPQILMDVSTHGVVEANGPRARTGIFRVVDETVKALIKREIPGIQLCAVRRPVHAIRYCQKDAILSRRPFATAPFQRIAARNPYMAPLSSLERALRPAALSPAVAGAVYWCGHYHYLATAPSRFSQRIVTIHDLLPLEHPQWFPLQESIILEKALDRIRRENWFVVFDTQHVRAKAVSLAGIPLERSTVIHPGIDHELFTPPTHASSILSARDFIGIDPLSPYFLTLCTREPRKGLGTAVRAFAQADRDNLISKATQLVLVGSHGWGTRDLDEALSGAEGLKERIHMPGFVPDKHLPSLYAGSIAFLFPSLAEGFGFPPLEAMACGCPVLASDTSCMPEVLGEAAQRLPPLEIDTWARAMGQAFLSQGNTQQRNACIEKSRTYSWEKAGAQLEKLFNGNRVPLETLEL